MQNDSSHPQPDNTHTYRSEHGQIQMLFASLRWTDTADNFRAIIQCLFTMKCSLFAGESLNDNLAGRC